MAEYFFPKMSKIYEEKWDKVLNIVWFNEAFNNGLLPAGNMLNIR